jgi:uncharacterized protein YndB with AHSA1/START domain
MKRLLLCLAWVFCVSPAAFAESVTECSRIEANGVRTLCVEAEVPAGVADVWALWAESDQLSTWMAPVASIDLRHGGLMEASYDPAGRIGDAGNILNRVVAVAPMRSLSIQVERAPPGFPHADVVRELVTVIELAPVGENATRVRVSMSGYGDGAAYDELYAFFARGNAWTLQKLQERVIGGPVDWRAAATE